MEKIINSHGEHLEPVTLYFDDLEKIIEIFKEGSDKVRISTNEYNLANLGEINQNQGGKINSLSIQILNPHVSLSFRPNSIWLFINEDEPTSRGIYEKIKHFLRKRRRKLYWLTRNSLPAGFIVGIAAWFFCSGISSKNRNYVLVGCVFIILAAIWTGIFERRSKEYTIIYLKKRVESTSFWDRKKDEIILIIISAIVGALITLIITNLWKK